MPWRRLWVLAGASGGDVMTKFRGIVSALVCATLVSGAFPRVHAADVQVDADARCIVVAMHIASLGTAVQRTAGMMIAMYYFGRLDDRAPHANVERLIENEAKKMTMAELRANAARCGKALRVESHEFASIGEDLARQAQGSAPSK